MIEKTKHLAETLVPGSEVVYGALLFLLFWRKALPDTGLTIPRSMFAGDTGTSPTEISGPLQTTHILYFLILQIP
jgi:hypothetical protein